MILIKISLLLFSPILFAATPVETGNITQLLAHKSPTTPEGRFIVKLSKTIALNPCTTGSDSWSGYFSDETGRAQYSTLLAASMTGAEIRIEGTEGYCEHNTALIRNVYIKY